MYRLKVREKEANDIPAIGPLRVLQLLATGISK